jgi:hypothetical protein
MEKKSLFQNLIKYDLITAFEPLFQKGHCYLNDEGKIELLRTVEHNSNWLHIQNDNKRACHFATEILFKTVFRQKMVPSLCQNCWKVVITPRTLSELFATYVMQKELGFNSKCGIEGDRSNTNRLYGGYFYNRTLEEGKLCFSIIEKELKKQKTYKLKVFDVEEEVMFDDPLPELILKRGCTEMEQACGASDKWAVSDRQKEIEKIVNEAVVQNEDDYFDYRNPYYQVAHTMKRWIASAYKWGDSNYLKFTGGKFLFPSPVIYQRN